MPDPPRDPAFQNPLDASGRRRALRLRSKSRVVVLRDSDPMRLGLPGALLDVSVDGLGFAVDASLELGEQIKIRVRNEVQRFEKEVRGVVRRVSADEHGAFLIGVELRSRLTPLDVSLLRSGLLGTPDGSGTAWV